MTTAETAPEEAPKKAPDKTKGARRQGRTLAFQVLFGLAFDPQTEQGQLRRAFARNPAVEDCELPEAVTFASELVLGVVQNLAEIDQVIGRHSDHWKIGRIAKIELSILRLSLYEILHRPDIPLKVAINEAIELAKGFGDENSRAFVNGILDAVARGVDQGRFGIEKKIDKKIEKKTDTKPGAKGPAK